VSQRLDVERKWCREGKPPVPSSLELEKRTNPFLRADTDAMRRATGLPQGSPVEVFAELRRRKDRW
jgi:hydroxyacylglutathione hydrolase